MIRLNCIAFLAAAVLVTLATAHAETLIIENIDKSSAALTASPNRGMSMETVEAKWGRPQQKRDAVGEPPISRWEYPGFIVYFEYSHVIHAVTKR